MSSLNKFLLVLVLGVTVLTTVPRATAQADVAHFNLFPNPKFASCLGVSGGATPAAKVTVYRGKLNDTLVISAKNIRPGLAFDMFTVQRTNLLPDATTQSPATRSGASPPAIPKLIMPAAPRATAVSSAARSSKA